MTCDRCGVPMAQGYDIPIRGKVHRLCVSCVFIFATGL